MGLKARITSADQCQKCGRRIQVVLLSGAQVDGRCSECGVLDESLYRCPRCNAELQRADYRRWVRYEGDPDIFICHSCYAVWDGEQLEDHLDRLVPYLMRCLHCGGAIILSSDDEPRCLLCARTVTPPETPRQREQRTLRQIRAEMINWHAPLVGARRHVRKGNP